VRQSKPRKRCVERRPVTGKAAAPSPRPCSGVTFLASSASTMAAPRAQFLTTAFPMTLIADTRERSEFAVPNAARLTVRSVRPAGCAIPDEALVRRLMPGLGLPTRRAAHLRFCITALGFQTLTTYIFYRADPAIDRDLLFCVHPDLLTEVHPVSEGWSSAFQFVLACLRDEA